MSEPIRVIGIDGGGTKTRAVLVDGTGRMLGRGHGGGTNFQRIGPGEVGQRLDRLMDRVFASARMARGRVDVLCVGLAGVDRRADREELVRVVERLDAAEDVHVTSDGAIALEGAHGGEPGIVVISGTGSIAWGKNEQQDRARAGGWGYLLGDEGSGYRIGREAIATALRAWDGMGPQTVLERRLCEEKHLSSLDQIVRWVYGKDGGREGIAALCPMVFEAARDGDVVAQEIIEHAGCALGTLVGAVARRLRMQDRVRLGLIGGVFQEKDGLLPSLLHTAETEVGRVEVCTLRFSPAVGAALLAFKHIGASVTMTP